MRTKDEITIDYEKTMKEATWSWDERSFKTQAFIVELLLDVRDLLAENKIQYDGSYEHKR